jgi:pyruvate formate lyase activating enzyme
VACPAKAIRVIGEYYTSDQVLKLVLEDCSFYTRSGGGMTLSGGEPLLQLEFVRDLLELCHQNGIDTAIETSGHVPWKNLKMVHERLSTIYYDIKVMDPIIHKKYTGVDNELILQNIIKLSSVCSTPKIIVRTPVLPGINDSEDNIRATVEFINGLSGVRKYELLPYHRFGESKYQYLGRNYGLTGVEKPSEEHMENLRSLVNF